MKRVLRKLPFLVPSFLGKYFFMVCKPKLRNAIACFCPLYKPCVSMLSTDFILELGRKIHLTLEKYPAMDFKGITWAGNIYQKFETMCLEVEEVMYEDTAKYVENQVQKVGVSVKKFYSEVMQDLLPPSCVDPVKVAAGDLSLNPYTHTDVNKKPKPSMLDSHGELKKKETEDEDISDLTAEESSLRVCNDAHHLSTLSPRVLVENARSDVCSTKSKKVGVYRRPIGIKRISQNIHPPKISRPMTSLSGDRSSLLMCDVRSSCLAASDDMNVKTSSEFFVRRDPGEAVNDNTPISEASVESLASDKILSADSVRQEKEDSECTSPASDKILSVESLGQNKDYSQCTLSCHGMPAKPIGTSMKDNSFSPSGSSFRNNAHDVESVGQDVMMSYEDKFRKDGLFSQINSNIGNDTCDVESVGEEVIVSYEDNFGMEVIENEEAVEPRVEIFEPVEKSKLEETCILVEGDKLHFVSQGTEKHKSYKKKIREALSSKLRSTRKQDQCVSHYKDLSGKNNAGVVIPALTMDSDKRKLPAHDSFESDWELL
ncbi:hypothetical protein Pfo_013813 [Paulownia fortunei]|nr:hypothetical protein Pfo_013813 [Paulownia fortunei]